MEENNIPEEYKPISMWGYLGYSILFAIPFVGIIVAIVFAFGGQKNINVRNYARGLLLAVAIMLVLWVLVAAILGASISTVMMDAARSGALY